MMSLWDALRMNMMISYQELVRTFPSFWASLRVVKPSIPTSLSSSNALLITLLLSNLDIINS
ncbi:hypothetical protein FJMB80199_47690 (plasmid) [Enterobacter hormaechei]|nr:hypothetical protein FJMB80199_47690 [Enterobacter hormaechei]